MAKRAQILEGVAPEVRAACPLTAQQVSRSFRMGRVWRVRPSSVELWLAGLENDQARGLR